MRLNWEKDADHVDQTTAEANLAATWWTMARRGRAGSVMAQQQRSCTLITGLVVGPESRLGDRLLLFLFFEIYFGRWIINHL